MNTEINQLDEEGLRHGLWRLHDETSNWKGTYSHGKMNGLWEEYYDSGSLWFTEFNVNDTIEGERLKYVFY